MLSKIKNLFKTHKNKESKTQNNEWMIEDEYKKKLLIKKKTWDDERMIEQYEQEALKKARDIALELCKQLSKNKEKPDKFYINLGEGVVVELDKSTEKNIIYIKHYEKIVGKIIM